MIHEDFAFLDPLIEMEQWCTRGLAEDDHSLLMLQKTLPPSIRLDLIQLIFVSVLGSGGVRDTQPQA